MQTDARFLIAVIPRAHSEDYIDFFVRNKVSAVWSGLCRGTAQKKTLDLLGLEDRELSMLSCITDKKQADILLKLLVREMRIDAPNEGVAFTISAAVYNKTTEDNNEVSEEDEMQNTPFTVIVAIAQGGYSETVMDAARSAGATGGTVIHAKGTGNQKTSKFFGMTIAQEKDMVYIVAKREDKAAIINAVTKAAGSGTEANAFVFAMPVEDVAGLASLNN